MLVGKTYPSISQDDVLSKYSEVQILTAVFPEVTQLPCKISSPFRTDSHPSFSIFLDDDNHVRYKDFGKPDEKGGLLKLLCRFWKCTLSQALDRICKLGSGCAEDSIQRIDHIKALKRSEASHLSDIQVKTRPWRDYDYEYWASYGITKKWLRYAEIYPISHKVITKRTDASSEAKTYVFPADKYAYCFPERKEGKLSLKVYQPFNTKGFKWSSKMDRSVIGLWTKMPKEGSRIVICSSLKDALCLMCQCNIPAICLQGEGYGISNTAANELRRRFRNVFICFDTDKPGIEDSKRLAEQTGFTNIIPDLGTEKDLSDAYRKYGREWFVSSIKPLFEC